MKSSTLALFAGWIAGLTCGLTSVDTWQQLLVAVAVGGLVFVIAGQTIGKQRQR